MDPSESLITAELARVLESRTFARSGRARDLLSYLIGTKRSGHAERLKESAVAIDVFSRDASTYDSATDGIVRVSINRLREHLDRYYQSEGCGDTLRFEIQRGGYVPIIRRATPPGLPEMPRIAVLPLANFTGDPSAEALCDGLTEDLIDAMTRLPAVRVIARTSSFRYKNRSADIRTIAQELSVDALLEGSLQRVGEQLRLTAQLILAKDGTHLWSHAFVFRDAERSELQQALVDLMLRSLGRPDEADAAAAPNRPARTAPSASVQALIDQARGLNVTQVPENIVFAEAIARRATELAPDYADAWFVLAMVRYSRRMSLADAINASGGESAASALDTALALQPDHAQAMSLSSYLLITESKRWNDGMASARRATQMAPNHAGVRARLAYLQLCFGEFAASVDSYSLSLSLDPLAPPAHFHYALALAAAGRFDDALAAIEVGRTLLGESIFLQDVLCAIMELSGDAQRAADTANTALQTYPTSRNIMMHVAYSRAALGDMTGARALSEKLVTGTTAACPYLRMYVESAGPDADAFFSLAHRVAKSNEPHIMLLPHYPAFKRHRTDARWMQVLTALKFPVQQRSEPPLG